jgi:hypothetical protein
MRHQTAWQRSPSKVGCLDSGRVDAGTVSGAFAAMMPEVGCWWLTDRSHRVGRWWV